MTILKDRFKSILSVNESTKWLSKGNVLAETYKIDKCQEALACYDKAIEANPKNSIAWSNKAHVLAGFNYFKDALECVDKAIELDPKNSEAWYRKANYLYKIGATVEKVFECYDKAIEANPRNIGALTNKAAFLCDTRQYQEAIECCKKAITVCYKTWEVWYTKAWSEERVHLTQDAILSFKNFLRFAPESEDRKILSAIREIKYLSKE